MKLYDKGLKYNYELYKKMLDIKKLEINNRYKIANSVIRRINHIDNGEIILYAFFYLINLNIVE